ncbi:MAG: NfeD family protein [Verrucomicrobiia bacterium]|jgi:membrane-bound serine protease (ClpP class)
MWEWIVLLLVIGLVLVTVEVFLPSGLFGVAGGLCLIAAIAITYSDYGVAAGTWLLGGVILATLFGLILWVKFFPKTATGRSMMLNQTSGNVAPEQDFAALLHKRGVARSHLRPSGIAEIEGRRVDVISEGGMIPPDTEVQVVAVDGTKIVVRKV